MSRMLQIWDILWFQLDVLGTNGRMSEILFGRKIRIFGLTLRVYTLQ